MLGQLPQAAVHVARQTLGVAAVPDAARKVGDPGHVARRWQWPLQGTPPAGPLALPHGHLTRRSSAEWRLLWLGDLWWEFKVRDDVGTEYEVQSGSTGFMARDKSVFDSDLDFEPAVSQEATALEVVFVNQRHPKEPVFTLRAELAMIEAGNEHLPSAGRDDRHNPGGTSR